MTSFTAFLSVLGEMIGTPEKELPATILKALEGYGVVRKDISQTPGGDTEVDAIRIELCAPLSLSCIRFAVAVDGVVTGVQAVLRKEVSTIRLLTVLKRPCYLQPIESYRRAGDHPLEPYEASHLLSWEVEGKTLVSSAYRNGMVYDFWLVAPAFASASESNNRRLLQDLCREADQ